MSDRETTRDVSRLCRTDTFDGTEVEVGATGFELWYCGVWCGVKALGRHAPPRAQWPGRDQSGDRRRRRRKKKEHALG